MLTRHDWYSSLEEERTFWRGWLTCDKASIKSQRENRLRAGRQLPPEFAERAGALDRPLRLLDLGAGPLTTLGTRIGEREHELVPVDPLADGYDELLAETDIVPLVRTISGEAERLIEQFGPESFDGVNCANALDHFHDPLTAIDQCLGVLRPEAVLRVRVHVNVAEKESYKGLHQWNFRIEEGRLELWNPTMRQDIAVYLDGRGDICELRVDPDGLIYFLIRKLGGAPSST